MADEEPLYAERGASWFLVLLGPAFAGLGLIAELLTGPVAWWLWIGTAVVLAGFIAIFVHARRIHGSVRLTESELVQGAESLSVARVRGVSQVSGAARTTARVLGASPGTTSVPRGCNAVPLRLDDGTVVVAWARDDEALRSALTRIVGV